MALSKNKIKQIKSLELKKNRKQEGVFVAEGNKLVKDNLPYMKCRTIVATSQWLADNRDISAEEIIEADKDEINKISFLKTPQDVIAVFYTPEYTLDTASLKNKLSIVLDSVQDPGNMGTIIRLADWFGIEDIICSPATVDCYNPKTVQSTMGAIARVKIHYTPLEEFFREMEGMPVYGTYLEGENIYRTELTANGLIVMGNEGSGISGQIAPFITKKLNIPSFPPERETSESLNVAIATSIVCSEFRRR